MTKNSQIRKYNLVSKFNKQEYSLILTAFEDSGFSTLGHFHRETLLKALKEQGAPYESCEVPPINDLISGLCRAGARLARGWRGPAGSWSERSSG